MSDTEALIDSVTGTVRLPDGSAIRPDLTLDAFEADPRFAKNRSVIYGAPWWRFDFPAGEIDGRQLIVSVHFYDQTLLSVELCVDHYPPDAETVSGEIAAATKDFHDGLLIGMLGKPAKTIANPVMSSTLEWRYPWGTVSSTFIGQSCSSLIVVRHGNRREEAYELDRKRPPYL